MEGAMIVMVAADSRDGSAGGGNVKVQLLETD